MGDPSLDSSCSPREGDPRKYGAGDVACVKGRLRRPYISGLKGNYLYYSFAIGLLGNI